MFIHQKYMHHALEVASSNSKEVPVGALIVKGSDVISSSSNEVVTANDPTAHAEILAIRKATNILSSYNLNDCSLYTTLEPCPMCAYAIALARIKNLYFAAYDKKRGAVESNLRIFDQKFCFHIPNVYGGLMEFEARSLLLNFFNKIRNKKQL